MCMEGGMVAADGVLVLISGVLVQLSSRLDQLGCSFGWFFAVLMLGWCFLAADFVKALSSLADPCLSYVQQFYQGLVLVCCSFNEKVVLVLVCAKLCSRLDQLCCSFGGYCCEDAGLVCGCRLCCCVGM
ncbi:hypothetical protein U1Q18_004854 [Sarracenia purpurea var. burkii]